MLATRDFELINDLAWFLYTASRTIGKIPGATVNGPGSGILFQRKSHMRGS